MQWRTMTVLVSWMKQGLQMNAAADRPRASRFIRASPPPAFPQPGITPPVRVTPIDPKAITRDLACW